MADKFMMEATIVQRLDEARRNDSSHVFSRFLFGAFVTLAILVGAQSMPSRVMAAEQLTFDTPDAAVTAMV
ncbi:MAG: hypothetical protein ACI9MJ_002335, partial [Alphaproteobacteria bacterium]